MRWREEFVDPVTTRKEMEEAVERMRKGQKRTLQVDIDNCRIMSDE